MIHSIHHLSIVVADLDTAATDYATLLGRAPDGAVEADGTRQVWFSTGNLRLVLVVPQGAGPQADAARTRLAQTGEGLSNIAFAVDDLDAAMHLFERRMLAPGAATLRPIATGTGAATVRASRLAVSATHGVDIVLVEAKRAEGPNAAPGTISGLDHVVIRTPDPGRAVELYAGRLGLDLRLDRSNAAWGMRQMFLRCGDLVVEIVHELKAGASDGPDLFGGLAWRANDIAATRERLLNAGRDVSDIRNGRKPGSTVCTVRNRNHGAPTILFG